MGRCLIAQSQMPRQWRKHPCHGICGDVACLSRFLLDLCHPDLSCKDCPLACCPGSVLTALEACSCLQATRAQLKFGCPDCPTLPTSVEIQRDSPSQHKLPSLLQDRYDRWRFADDLQDHCGGLTDWPCLFGSSRQSVLSLCIDGLLPS